MIRAQRSVVWRSIRDYAGSRASSFARLARRENAHDELIEVDSRLFGGHGHQAVVGHAGRGIHFEKIRLAGAVENHIDTRPSLATDQTIRFERLALNRLLFIRGKSARA